MSSSGAVAGAEAGKRGTAQGQYSNTEHAGAAGSGMNAIEQAKARMASLGETWAEEEQLPGTWTTTSGNHAVELGGGNDPSSLCGGVSVRDVKLAGARMDKVKTAKRNAKFK